MLIISGNRVRACIGYNLENIRLSIKGPVEAEVKRRASEVGVKRVLGSSAAQGQRIDNIGAAFYASSGADADDGD
jgi:hypothetical protein